MAFFIILADIKRGTYLSSRDTMRSLLLSSTSILPVDCSKRLVGYGKSDHSLTNFPLESIQIMWFS